MHRARAVVLDACVLADFIISDLLLRMAEEPVLILPRWSEVILAEVRRTHRKLKGGPNTGSGRYSLADDTKSADNVRIWYQVDLVTA
jgi:hypothetical protein